MARIGFGLSSSVLAASALGACGSEVEPVVVAYAPLANGPLAVDLGQLDRNQRAVFTVAIELWWLPNHIRYVALLYS